MSHLPLLLVLMLVLMARSAQSTAPKSREQLTIELETLRQKVEQLEARENEAEKLGEKLGEALGEKLGDKLQEGITKLGEQQTTGMETLGQKLTGGLDKLGQTLAASQTCGTDKTETTPTTMRPQPQPVTCPPCKTEQNVHTPVGFFTYLNGDSPRAVQQHGNPLDQNQGRSLINQGNGFDRATGIFTAPVNGTYFFFSSGVTDGNFTSKYLLNLHSSFLVNSPRPCDICTGASYITRNLTKGQNVYPGSYAAGNFYPYSTVFGGFLIREN
ncbi:hypothetical protein BaRGS_00035438 [Batillaria attramentaria]|uniref:C1q domain-containing protein n=1 Tax=Batillaria attramentaria TaxID=370345 RepID=A0ABD0JEA1_9CAEN